MWLRPAIFIQDESACRGEKGSWGGDSGFSSENLGHHIQPAEPEPTDSVFQSGLKCHLGPVRVSFL